MSKYSVTISGTIDGDDPELAYLSKESDQFRTPQDVVDYLTDVLAEELALETTEIRVDELKNKLRRKQSVFK